jgi:hypothetical protein
MSDVRAFEPYSISNMIKRAIEKNIMDSDHLSFHEAEEIACHEVESFIEFLVNEYFSTKQARKENRHGNNLAYLDKLRNLPKNEDERRIVLEEYRDYILRTAGR